MANEDMSQVDHLIEEFLANNPEPTAGDWKRLIDQYPRFAGAIADAALIRRNSAAFDETQASAGALDETLFNETISHVLNVVHDTPSMSLKEGKERVNAILGPATRKIAEEIGIGPYPSLLNGVLVGRTVAPLCVLKALEARLEVPILVLSELFRCSFAETEVPAYKAIGGKPQLQSRPRTWRDAVKDMNLSPDETARLMKLSEDA